MTQPINAQIAKLIRNANDAAAAGDYRQAQTIAQTAVTQSKVIFHGPTQATAHYTYATMLWSDETASAETAREHAAKAVEMAVPHTEEYYMAMTLLARINAGIGNFEKAQELNQKLLQTYEHKGRKKGIADVYRNFGDIALKQNDLLAAQSYFAQSVSLYEKEVDDPLNHAGALISIGLLAYRQNQPETARTYWEQAQQLGEKHGFVQVVEYAQRGLDVISENDAENNA